MNSKILRSALKEYKRSLVIYGIIATSIILAGIGLPNKLGKTGFTLGITGFIPLAVFSLLFTLITVCDVSNDIKMHRKVTKDRIKFMTMTTIPLVFGTVLTGIGLFGNKLDSNVRFITDIVGFAALSLFALASIIETVQFIKRNYDSKIKNANCENGVKDQKLHTI